LSELTGTRARIVTYVAERGAARMKQIMTDLGLTTGMAGGHLHWLVQNKHLERPARGVYIIPGTAPELPPRPSLSGAVAKRNRKVWENLDEAERRRRVDALTAGRQKAAQDRKAG
jgi:hypothetical protein